ncbi:MAG: hypothetical protein KIS77_20040 [Saprospiraceae bacterium]|nr:hypothetical protein [Saprospiraceae bacterium]
MADSTMRQLAAIKITLKVNHSWGAGDEEFAIEYERRDTFFATRSARYQYSGRVYPPKRKGEGAVVSDTFFKRSFQSEHLSSVLKNIQQPSPYWNESDFGYVKSKFRTDLTHLIRERWSNYRTCDDCSYHWLEIQFLKDGKQAAAISINFDSGFRLPRVEDTALKAFQVRKMLEWMYLYQLSHLFFPDDVALNKSHFQEKRIHELAIWAKHFFPELNK